MEYLPNGSVEKRLEHGDVSIVEAVRWCRDALDGLAHAHSLGIVHRDVKPGNLLLDWQQRAVVSDFGLAEDTIQKRVAGPAFYLPHAAPELLTGLGSSPQTDIWAIGCTLYRLLVHQPPFATEPEVLAGVHVRPHKLDPQIPMSISRVIERALAVDPANRYSTAHEMLAELLDCSVVNAWRDVVRPGAIAGWECVTSGGIAYDMDVTQSRLGVRVRLRRDRGRGPRTLRSAVFKTEGRALRRARTFLVAVVEGRSP
jgi:serine/threonine-protein kinase